MGCPTPTTLERFWLESCDTNDLKGHVTSCPKCQERLQIWEGERRAFLQKYPFGRFEKEVAAEDNLLSRLWHLIAAPSTAWKASFALATVAVLAVILLLPHERQETIMSKGGSSVGFYVVHNGEGREGRDEMKLSPGDELKFYYTSDMPGFLLLVGLEEDGALNVYYPMAGSASQPIGRGTKVFLPDSIRWRPHTHSEKFYAIVSEKPISTRELSAYIKDGRLQNSMTHMKEIVRIDKPSTSYSVTDFTIYRK